MPYHDRGFCVKCKAKRKIQNPKEIVTKNRRRAVQGTCPVCGTKMFKFLPTK
jgi:RNase P subunit RPR2